MSRKGYVKKAKHFLYRLCGALLLTAWLTLPNDRVSNFLLISIFEKGGLFLKLLEEFNKVKAENKKCSELYVTDKLICCKKCVNCKNDMD